MTKRPECQLGDELQSFKDSDARRSDGLDVIVFFLRIEPADHVIDAGDARQIAFVELDDERNVVHLQTDLRQILAKIVEALQIRILHRALRIGDEDDSFSTSLRVVL